MSKRISLDRILQSQGFGTRKWCSELIAAGEVEVAGVTVTDNRVAMETEGLIFKVYGETWIYREKLYIALNKPGNYECSRKASHHPGVLSIFPEQFDRRGVQPVGRLDHDTTGLLLLSDDGLFIHNQSSPRHHIPKAYEVSTHDPVTPELIAMFIAGVKLHDEPVPLAAASCRIISSHLLEVVLKQGKYHQVKRMVAAAGNHCIALRRSRIGGLGLDGLGLSEGHWCYLGARQLAQLAPD